MVPTYSMMGPFRGHMSLKSSSFSPGPSCKLSHQYIIQDHMAAHYKKLMSAKAAVDSSAPKSMQTSVKCFYIPVSDLQTDVMTSTSGLTNSIFSPQSIDSVQITSDLAIGNFVCQSNRNSRKSSRSLLGIKQSCKSSILPPAVSWLQSFETSLLFQKSSGVKHQPTLLKHLVGTKPELPLQAKNEGMSQDKDQQKRDRLIQALEKYKKDLERGLPASPLNSRSVSPSRRKARRSLLENCHLYLTSGRNNCSRTKREQPPSVCFQQLTSRTLIPAPTARKPIRKTAQHALPQAPAHNSSTDRCYNPPSQKKSSSPGRSSLKSADINNEKKRKLHRFLEDAHVRPHSGHFSQQPVELGVPGLLQRTRMVPTVHTQIHELWIPDSEMPLSPGSQLEEKEEYLHFLQDLTNDILIRGCYDKEALEDIFQMHIKSKRYNLDEVKRRRIVQSLKSELNITSQPASSTSCKGTRSKDTSTPAPCF